jgi:hypothetical protein
MTDHPSRLSAWVTRRSRRLFASILLRQNSVLLRGRYLQRRPCQKQPSTKTAIFRAGEDPDQLSYIHAVRVVRRKMTTFDSIPPQDLAKSRK